MVVEVSTALMSACQENDINKAEGLLSSDQQISTSTADQSGKVAMHHCAERGDLELFKKIFESNPSVMDKRDNDGYTPLTFAVIGGNGPVVDFLLEKGADANNVDSEKHSLVHWATVCAHADILIKLLKTGALPSTPDLFGAHALHYATQTDAFEKEARVSATSVEGMEILRILLKFGANVNCADFDERTPLLWAASCGNCAAITALLEAGADKHEFDKDKLTALHCAASRGHANVIRLICKSSSNVQINSRDRNGSSPLFYAAALGHVEATKVLLDYQAMTDIQDKKLRTVAHCAAAKGQLGTLKLLHQFGASFALENYRGDLPIHEAVQAGGLELITWMLSLAPAYANATNHDGRTPLHLAAALGHLDTCRLLIGKGANKDALMLSKSACVTALDLAEEKAHQPVVDYLRGIEAQRCAELTPQSIVEEFKKHMATRKLALSKDSMKKSSAETQTDPKIRRSSRKKKNGKNKTAIFLRIDEADQILDSSRTSAGISEITGSTDDQNGVRAKENEDSGLIDTDQKQNHRSAEKSEISMGTDRTNGKKIANWQGQESENASSTGDSGNFSRALVIPSNSIDRFRIDWESSLRNRMQRYAEEKRIFQELASLKRLQIQYGNVQEEVIVRRLIDDFLRGYNVHSGDFQMFTFNAWEKFLYDQLKILYKKEKESLMQSYESKVKSQATLFEKKKSAGSARQRGIEDHIDRLSRAYGVAPIPMQYSPRLYKASFMNHP